MNIKKRSIIQIVILIIVLLISLIYSLYIRDLSNIKVLSLSNLNPYGGWSELKSVFTDVSYKFKGISRATALTASILLTSIFFGRFFCGFICPIGALQDFFSFIGNKLNIKKIKIKEKKNSKLVLIKYFVFIAVISLSIFGLGHIISPYSPWLAFLNIPMSLQFSVGTAVLLMILILSLFISRFFCRFLCPLGAFQSLLYAVGFFKVKNSSNCEGCNYCLNDCPVEIERPYESGEVSPECISCLKCTETTCIRDDYTYSINIFNRKLNKNKYIVFSLIVFISIYSFLPLIDTSAGSQDISNFGSLKNGIYIGTGVGFGGPLRIELTVDNKKIKNIEVINHRESTGYYEEVFKMKTREIAENQSLSIDTVSGATATSRGFFSAVKSAVSQSLEYNE